MLQEFFLEKDQKPSDLQGPKRIITHPVVATVVTVVLGMALATVGYEKVWGLFGAANQLLAVLALLAVCAWLGNIGKSNRMIYIPMMFMLAATLTSLLFTMGGRIGDLASGFDGVAAAAGDLRAPVCPGGVPHGRGAEGPQRPETGEAVGERVNDSAPFI